MYSYDNIIRYSTPVIELPTQMFEGSLRGIDGLFMDEMGITRLPPDMFKDVGSAKLIWLRKNEIQEIAETAMPPEVDGVGAITSPNSVRSPSKSS